MSHHLDISTSLILTFWSTIDLRLLCLQNKSLFSLSCNDANFFLQLKSPHTHTHTQTNKQTNKQNLFGQNHAYRNFCYTPQHFYPEDNLPRGACIIQHTHILTITYTTPTRVHRYNLHKHTDTHSHTHTHIHTQKCCTRRSHSFNCLFRFIQFRQSFLSLHDDCRNKMSWNQWTQ